jgi:SAM-dependent methyltransferase
LVLAEVARGGVPRNGVVVDVGCGTGGTIGTLKGEYPDFHIIAIDKEPRALEFAQRYGPSQLIQAGANDIPLAPQSADLIICLDVLYYADINFEKALGSFFNFLKPGGMVILNLPAFQFLRGQHDQAVGIARRFRSPEVARVLKGEGFQILKDTYWNMLLLPPLMIWRKLSRNPNAEKPTSDLEKTPRWLNGLLSFILGIEFLLIRFMRLPVGSSLFMVARKPGEERTHA